MSTRSNFRRLIAAKRGVVAPGAYDGISARLIERAGFEAVYLTGNGASASRLGAADFGFAGLAEMSDHARNLALSVSLPVIADADNGYGNALNVRRCVQIFETTGIAALHIEDQALPKRCGLLAGKTVVPADEFAQKIRAAVEARTDPDLMIIARTDAIAVHGFDDAMRRAEAAAKAGADMLFIQEPKDEKQIEQVARDFDLPLLFNYTPGERSPRVTIAELRSLGYALIILPLQALLVAARAVQSYLEDLAAGEVPAGLAARSLSFADFNALVGVDEQVALGDRYAS